MWVPVVGRHQAFTKAPKYLSENISKEVGCGGNKAKPNPSIASSKGVTVPLSAVARLGVPRVTSAGKEEGKGTKKLRSQAGGIVVKREAVLCPRPQEVDDDESSIEEPEPDLVALGEEVAVCRRRLAKSKSELSKLKQHRDDTLRKLQEAIDDKEYATSDLQLALESAEKRRALRSEHLALQKRRGNSSTSNNGCGINSSSNSSGSCSISADYTGIPRSSGSGSGSGSSSNRQTTRGSTHSGELGLKKMVSQSETVVEIDSCTEFGAGDNDKRGRQVVRKGANDVASFANGANDVASFANGANDVASFANGANDVASFANGANDVASFAIGANDAASFANGDPQPLLRVQSNYVPAGSRKTRALVLNPLCADQFATTDNNGGIKVWSLVDGSGEAAGGVGGASCNLTYQTSRLLQQHPNSNPADTPPQPCIPEDLCFHPTRSVLAVALRHAKQHVKLLPVPAPSTRRRQLSDAQAPKPLASLSSGLHSKGVSVLEWFSASSVGGGHGGDGAGAGGCSSLITSGTDHNVVLWQNVFEREGAGGRQQLLHAHHSAEVTSLQMGRSCGGSPLILSAGADGRVFAHDCGAGVVSWSLQKRKPAIEKFNCVLSHPTQPALVLTSSLQGGNRQLLRVWDQRCVSAQLESSDSTVGGKGVVLEMESRRWEGAPSLSQYVLPRISPSGLHVSCGSTQPLVLVWDVRAVRSARSSASAAAGAQPPTQTIQAHTMRVLSATWHPQRRLLMSVSADRTVGLHTYQL